MTQGERRGETADMHNAETQRRKLFLRLFRWRIVARSRPYRTAFILASVTFTVTVFLWRRVYKLAIVWSIASGDAALRLAQQHPHFARVMQVVLNAVPDVVPLVLGLAGLVYLMPNLAKNIERSKPLRLFVAVLCLLFMFTAVLVNAINREAQDHKSDSQQARITSVQTTNETILKTLLHPSADTSEIGRRKHIEEVLRNEWILSHNPVDPEILAGNAMPPEIWTNKRLAELGEVWTVAVSEPKPTNNPVNPMPVYVPPAPEKAHIEFGFFVPLGGDLDFTPNPITVNPQNFVLEIPMTFRIKGGEPAHSLHIWFRVCQGCSWAQEPPGFSPADPDRPNDREKFIGDFIPGPQYSVVRINVRMPNLVKDLSGVDVRASYACDNCSPNPTDNVQIMRVNLANPRLFIKQP